MKSYKWWEAPTLPQGIKWRYMEHCGVLFPPAYEPHGVKMKYNGNEVTLTPQEEEIATYYAQISPESLQLSNPKTAKVFNKNFWRDFVKILGPNHIIQKFELCDFEPIRNYLKIKSDERKAAPKEAKEAIKESKLILQLRHGFAVVDGHIEKMGNYTVEPPGLFRGRGEHPKMGVLKKRVMPEEITINVAHLAVVPPCPIPGHNWKRVVHDPTVTWLAYWKDNVAGNHKYVSLAASSSFKGRSDLNKYEKARRLKKYIGKIREYYEKLLNSEDEFQRQSGTAMWIIDRLALRVGGEKDEDEADTVGCCSLRVEHIAFPPDLEYHVTFDFLGKDSMRYFNTVNLRQPHYGDTKIGKAVYENLRKLTKKKNPDEDIFDMLTPERLNEQLSSLMPGLTAKVFRTYNASVTLEKELDNMPISASWTDKLLEYNRANREVAILCNHQKTVSAKETSTIQKMKEKVELLRSQLEELRTLREKYKAAGKKEPTGVPVKRDDSEFEKLARKNMKLKKEALQAMVTNANTTIETGDSNTATTLSSSTAATPVVSSLAPNATVAGQLLSKWNEETEYKLALTAAKAEDAHLWSKPPTDIGDIEKRISLWESKVDAAEAAVRNKDENKTVALGTSKINYMDPRITVAWCKKVELPIEKVFAKTLQDKFPWAMGAPSTFSF